ncbi:hypothetical protein B566_EDAN003941 [Ephemera danica]|nr:hypothetical protein B566_EDAN003941 [Ephemera danica]
MAQNSEQINTLVFFDTETTGLPAQERGRTHITELSLCAVRTCDLRNVTNGELPRAINKITLCLNPNKMIDPGASKVSRLNNDLLEYYGKFDEIVFRIIENFLLHLPKPICLIAHNGDKFDYPILTKELENIKKSLPEDILCADSVIFYRQFYAQQPRENKPERFKLCDIYKHLTKLPAPPNLHGAEEDSLVLMKCISLTPDIFPWLQKNAKTFTSSF